MALTHSDTLWHIATIPGSFLDDKCARRRSFWERRVYQFLKRCISWVSWERPDATWCNALKHFEATVNLWCVHHIAPLTLNNWQLDSLICVWFVDGAVRFWNFWMFFAKTLQVQWNSFDALPVFILAHSCCRQLSVIVLVPYWSALVWTNAKRRAWGGAEIAAIEN